MLPSEPKQSNKNTMSSRLIIELSETCGCFYCLQLFPPEKIKHWSYNGKEAICPHCNVNSVVGDKSGFVVDKKFLKDMHKIWY